jgi:hypothetical protein
MTNDDNSLLDLNNSLEKEFTRPASTHMVEDLFGVACDLFSSRSRADLKSVEIELTNLRQVLEMIAIIISKTYVECGDSFHLADDEALMLIRDRLVQYSPSIIARNKSKRMPKQLFL